MKGVKQNSMARLTKTQLVDVLLKKVEGWIASGVPPSEAVGKLTIRQYDFLIDQNVDLDKYLLTDEQKKNIRAVTRAPRSCSPNGYNKKYPQSKQDLYTALADFVRSQGAEIAEREKQNFRDLDFTIQGVKYKIVLSNPRS